MNKMRILILFGGKSSEHEVSRASAASILKNIDMDKYEIVCVGITKIGKWLYTKATANEIKDGSWETKTDNQSAVLTPDTTIGGLLLLEQHVIIPVDCVWPVLHGRNGEDGTIQGLCELAGLKYVGPDVCSSAICIDKAITKVLISKTQIKQADYFILHETEFLIDRNKALDSTEEAFRRKYPLFVKPASSGSSVGISKVCNRDELERAYRVAFEECNKVIVEEAIEGQEVEVAVLGNSQTKASKVGEILSAGDWYDYKSKYNDKNSRTVIPANISVETEQEIQKDALEIYKVLGCKGLSRVDFFVDHDNKVIFNEINTLPGFTDISMYPLLWDATGLEYSKLLDEIIKYAMEN